MALFDLPEEPKPQKNEKTQKLKLKKGQTINDLVEVARKTVLEKLGKYKDHSKCILYIDDLKKFFNETKEYIAIDTETMGLDTFGDRIVGISLDNEIESIYIPIYHINSSYNQPLTNLIPEQQIKDLFKEIKETRKELRWIYHNSRFDLAVLRTFLGFNMPDPYWDTLIAGHLLNQSEEHGLKYLFNKYVAVEDEGVNKFDTLFQGVPFAYISLDIATIYAGKDAYMTMQLFKKQREILTRPDMKGVLDVLLTIEMPLMPIICDMQRYRNKYEPRYVK